MKITLKDNPLASVVELNELESQKLWYELLVEDLEDRLTSTSFYLDENYSGFSIQRARAASSLAFMDEDDDAGTRAGRIDRLHKMYVYELTGEHVGDCTAVACSCSKCAAESKLGICTAPFGKHVNSSIAAAFHKPGTTIDQAIEILKVPIQPTPGYEAYTGSWQTTREFALSALLEHKKTLSVN